MKLNREFTLTLGGGAVLLIEIGLVVVLVTLVVLVVLTVLVVLVVPNCTKF